MTLSKYFTEGEFAASSIAKRHGWDNTMPPEVLQNAIDLCENILDPVREHFGKPLIITSGYRSPKLNKAVGGSKTSQHTLGQAADIRVLGVSHWDVLKYIYDNLPYDQLIAEYMVKGDPDDGWVHVSYKRSNSRKMALTINKAGVTAGINFA